MQVVERVNGYHLKWYFTNNENTADTSEPDVRGAQSDRLTTDEKSKSARSQRRCQIPVNPVSLRYVQAFSFVSIILY